MLTYLLASFCIASHAQVAVLEEVTPTIIFLRDFLKVWLFHVKFPLFFIGENSTFISYELLGREGIADLKWPNKRNMNPISSSPPISSIPPLSAPTNTANCVIATQSAPLELKKITIDQSHRIGKIDEGCDVFSLSANGKRIAATSASSREIFIYEVRLDDSTLNDSKLEKIGSFDRKMLPLDPHMHPISTVVSTFQEITPPFIQKGIKCVSKVPVIANILGDLSESIPISSSGFFRLSLSENGKLLFALSKDIACVWSCDIASEPRVIWRRSALTLLAPVPMKISSDMKWAIGRNILGTLLLSRLDSSEEDVLSTVQSTLPDAVGGKAQHILWSNKEISNNIAIATDTSSLPTLIIPDNNKWIASIEKKEICFTEIDKATPEIKKKVWSFSKELPITAVANSRDGKWLAFGRIDEDANIITLLNIKDQSDKKFTLKESFLKLEKGASKIIQMAFAKDSRWLASVSEDNIIRVWSRSMQTYEAKATVKFKVPASISEITWQKTDRKISLIIIATPKESTESEEYTKPKAFEVYVIDIGTREVAYNVA